MASQDEEEEFNSSATPETELDDTILCSPCDSDGKRLKAVGYCVNCKEYLCEACYKYHRYPSLTRKHVLLGQEQMGSVEERNIRCPEHEKRDIEYHCPTHAFFGCHVCCFQHQKTCKDSKYIPDVAETLPSSEEFKEFSAKLDHIATKTKQLILDAKHRSEKVDKQHAEEIAAVKAFKLQVLEAIDKLEKNLIIKAEQFKQAELAKWKTILDECKTIQEGNTAISIEIEVLQNKMRNDALYLTMVKSKDKVQVLEEDLNDIESDITESIFKFKRNDELLAIFNGHHGLGKLETFGTVSTVEHIRDINVKTDEDSSNCCIRGSVMMPERKLVIVDNNNNKLKLIDAKKHKLVSEIKLSNFPWSVAKVTDDTVAVTVPNDKKIVIVRTVPTLDVDRELDVKDNCHGVAYCDGNLIVTFRGSNNVRVMDLRGAVLHEIKTDQNGKTMFPSPYTVSVDTERGVMYVCNADQGNDVKCLKIDGTLVATYTDSELQYAQEAVVNGTGMVFVFGYHSKNVHLITSDCKKVKVILTGLTKPETICYDQNRRALFIGDQNNVKVFKVSYAPL